MVAMKAVLWVVLKADLMAAWMVGLLADSLVVTKVVAMAHY